jgi:hypothetical protein
VTALPTTITHLECSAGVVRMDREGRDVLATVMAEGLDHHYGLVYGDVLAGMAGHLGFETVWL